MTHVPGSWDDARLEAAYEALVREAPAVADLGDRTIHRLRASQASAPPSRRLPLLASAAVVVLAVVGVFGGLVLLGAKPIDPATGIFGLDVIPVDAALVVRDAGVDDRELAVRGWFSPIAPIGCPAVQRESPVQPACPDPWIVLMRDPQSLVTVTVDGFSGREPTGPAFQIDLDGLDTPWLPQLPTSGAAEPVELVLLGHFDDRRSAFCPPAEVEACRDRFVVDRVASVDGVTQMTTPLIGVAETISTADAVDTWVRVVAPGAATLSMTVESGAGELGRLEPSLATGQGGLIDEAAVWIVRALADGRVATYLVVDGSNEVWRMEPDGTVVRMPATVPEATPSRSATGERPEPWFPVIVSGLPVIDVAAAEAVRDAGHDDREIAVHGWLSVGPALSCAAPSRPPSSPLEPGCGTELHWLLRDPEVLVRQSEEDLDVTDPVGPAIHPAFTYANAQFSSLDRAWFDALPAGTDIESPWPVVVLGHFDDPMAAACRPEDRTICEDRFVIDRLAAIFGVPINVDAIIDRDAVTTTDEILELLDGLRPASEVLSLTSLPGRGLASFDPTRPTVAEQLAGELHVWVVRVLEDGRARSILITDHEHESFLIDDADGLVPLATAPRQTPPPWPPAGARLITLTSPVADGRPPARVALVDDSGRVTDAREAAAGDGAPEVGEEFAEMRMADGVQAYLLTWTGGPCDGDLTITLAEDLRTITISHGIQACDATGIRRSLVLTVDGGVDPAKVEVNHVVGIADAVRP